MEHVIWNRMVCNEESHIGMPRTIYSLLTIRSSKKKSSQRSSSILNRGCHTSRILSALKSPFLLTDEWMGKLAHFIAQRSLLVLQRHQRHRCRRKRFLIKATATSYNFEDLITKLIFKTTFFSFCHIIQFWPGSVPSTRKNFRLMSICIMMVMAYIHH